MLPRRVDGNCQVSRPASDNRGRLARSGLATYSVTAAAVVVIANYGDGGHGADDDTDDGSRSQHVLCAGGTQRIVLADEQRDVEQRLRAVATGKAREPMTLQSQAECGPCVRAIAHTDGYLEIQRRAAHAVVAREQIVGRRRSARQERDQGQGCVSSHGNLRQRCDDCESAPAPRRFGCASALSHFQGGRVSATDHTGRRRRYVFLSALQARHSARTPGARARTSRSRSSTRQSTGWTRWRCAAIGSPAFTRGSKAEASCTRSMKRSEERRVGKGVGERTV